MRCATRRRRRGWRSGWRINVNGGNGNADKCVGAEGAGLGAPGDPGSLNITRRVDDLPPTAKRIVVGIIGVAMTAAFTAAGVALPTECVASFAGSDFTEACATALTGKTTVQGITAALAAMILHALKKSNPRA
jgi:hypothetical protein